MIIMSPHDCTMPDFLTESDIFSQCTMRPCVECSFEIYVCHRYAMPQDCKLTIREIGQEDASKAAEFLKSIDSSFTTTQFNNSLGFAVIVDNNFIGIAYVSNITVKFLC